MHLLRARPVRRNPVPEFVATAFARQLGRIVTLGDAGFPTCGDIDPAASLLYSAAIGETIETVTDLARADMERRDFLKGALVSAAAMGLASRDWLVAAPDEDLGRAGWMTYDQNRRALASRYYIQALRLAAAAEDPQIAAHILTRMSYLALDENLPAEAVAQARAASHAAGRTQNSRVQAYTHIVEARAHAAAGAHREAANALARVDSIYDPRVEDAPGWALVHDPAELANQFAHVYLDLGDAKRGLTSIATAIAGKTDSTRRSLAKSHVRAARLFIVDGQIEAALDHSATVVRTLPALASARVHAQLTPVRRELVRASGPTSCYVRQFDEQSQASL